MPIRLRLVLLVVVGTIIATFLGGVLFVDQLSSGLRSSTLTSLEVRANAITQQLPDQGGQTGAGTGVQDPGALPSTPASVDAQELTQVISSTGKISDASGPGTSASLLNAAQLALARHHALVVEKTIPGQAGSFLLLASPFGSNVVLVVGISLSTVNQAVDRVVAEIFIGGAIGVVIAGVGAWFLAGAALRPVERMRRQAAEISEHDADATLAVPRSRDELALLAQTLNGLLERLHGALSRQRSFVSAAGHELRSPLAILKGELELGGRPGRTKAELSDALTSAAAETDHIIHLADDLLTLSRGDEQALTLQPSPTDLVALVTQSTDAFQLRAVSAGVTLQVVAPTGIVAEVDPQRFRQIVDNLIDNALRYSPPQSTVQVSVEESGDTAVFTVKDEGPGFPEDFLPHAFDRFTRPDSSRNRDAGGTGLGLAIVSSLAEAHGGTATAANRTEGGAVVTIVLPMKPEPAS